MNNAAPIDVVSVHWMPMMSSCTLSFHRGEICEDGVTFRANVEFGAPSPDGWQAELDAFRHDARHTLDEARSLLAALGPAAWDDDVHFALGSAELRGQTQSLKLWLTCHSPAGAKAPTEEQYEITKTRLIALRKEVWG